MSRRRDWTCPELATLKREYPTGTPTKEISAMVGHSSGEVQRKAREMGLRHPAWDSALAIANFEQAHDATLIEVARNYRDRRLSRTTLASDIGIGVPTLKHALPSDLWQSWPRMTLGRIDEARRRRKAA